MGTKIRWGILSTGRIAHEFAEDLRITPGAELVAVGSRTKESADAFAREFAIPHSHASYGALADDGDVDVVYVATPHPMHKDNTLLCLNAGKAVLCEKPFTINAAEAREIVQVARAKKLFCMEAMWMRFLPSMVRVRKLIADDAIGHVRMLTAAIGFRAHWRPDERILNPALGGGALLDVGVYAISLAGMLMGRPTGAVGLAHIGETGVDEQAGMVLSYETGRLAVIATGVRTHSLHEAAILGEEGKIILHAPWWHSEKLTVMRRRHRMPPMTPGQPKPPKPVQPYAPPEPPEDIDCPKGGNGFHHEASEVMRCMNAGLLESPIIPLDESISIMETMDALRAQWGLKYPME